MMMMTTTTMPPLKKTKMKMAKPTKIQQRNSELNKSSSFTSFSPFKKRKKELNDLTRNYKIMSCHLDVVVFPLNFIKVFLRFVLFFC